MSVGLFKRILSGLLVVLMILTTPLTALAESPGGSASATRPIPTPGGSGYTPTTGIYDDYGFRVTITSNQPLKDANIPILYGNYTDDDIIKQRADIENITRTRYWEPGNYGIYFWAKRNTRIKIVKVVKPGKGEYLSWHS